MNLNVKKIILFILISIAALILGIYAYNMDFEEEIKEEPIKEIKEKHINLKVDIKGHVINPGVYELDENSRVIDVINVAGGLSKNADTSIINLSKKIKDEMVIIIYSKSEIEKMKINEEKISCPEVNNACTSNDQIESLVETKEAQSKSDKISINTASVTELQNLEGIGVSKAEAIIKYREINGPFKTVEEIKNVSGIGESIFEKIKDNIII